jgi:DNA polymerase III epsilon subunit-like protein
LKPITTISPVITGITGISNEMVATAPFFKKWQMTVSHS